MRSQQFYDVLECILSSNGLYKGVTRCVDRNTVEILRRNFILGMCPTSRAKNGGNVVLCDLGGGGSLPGNVFGETRPK